MTVVAEPVVSGWLNESFVKQLIDLRPSFWPSLLDLWGEPFSICQAICVYLTVPNEALGAVPNTSILCPGFGATPRWAGFLTSAMLMLLGGSWPYPGPWATSARGRSPAPQPPWPQALQQFAHSGLRGSRKFLFPWIWLALPHLFKPFPESFLPEIICLHVTQYSLFYTMSLPVISAFAILSASFLPGYKCARGPTPLTAASFFRWLPPSIPISLSCYFLCGQDRWFSSLYCTWTTERKIFACLDKELNKTITAWKNECFGVSLKEKTKKSCVSKLGKERLRREGRSGERRRVGNETPKGKRANESAQSGRSRKRQRVINEEEPGICESGRNECETWRTVKGWLGRWLTDFLGANYLPYQGWGPALGPMFP